MVVITAFISPFRQEREMARELIEPENFVEVYVDTPLDVCEQRDVKGLYRKARAGQLPNLSGIGSAYGAAGGATACDKRQHVAACRKRAPFERRAARKLIVAVDAILDGQQQLRHALNFISERWEYPLLLPRYARDRYIRNARAQITEFQRVNS